MTIKRYTQGDLVAVIDSLGQSAHTVNDTIHVVQVNVLEHTMIHGDYTGGERLLNVMPRGQRVKAMAFWFRHFSNGKLDYRFDNEKKLWVGKLLKDRVPKDFDIESAEAMHFQDLTAEKDPQSVTIKTILKSLTARATNAKLFDNGMPEVEPAARAYASRLLALAKSDEELLKLVPSA